MESHPLSSYYEEDHDRLDGLFREFQRLKRTDPAKARESFRQFKFGLQRHIIWEEEILFPLYEGKTGSTVGGPTEAMRREHRHIGSLLESIHHKVRSGDLESDQDEANLIIVLRMHNMKEEQILYPAIARSLGGGEEAAVFEAMRSIPEERYETCCEPSPGKSA